MTKILAGLISRGHEVVYCVGPDGYAPQQEFPNTVFEGHFEAWDDLNLYYEGAFKYPPASKELIVQMYKTEAIVLSMMNKRSKNANVNERKHYYYNKLGYWHGALTKFKPDAVVFPIIPHKSYQFIIHELALLLGIKTVSFQETVVSDRVMVYQNFWQGSALMKQAQTKNTGQNFSLNDLSPDIKNYYQQYTSPGFDRTPDYMLDWKNRFSVINKIFGKIKIIGQSFADLSIFKKSGNYFYKLFVENIKKEYLKLQQEPDFNQPYVYLPLHFQPERTTCPQGDVFDDQILMAETLSNALPKDWLLYVKEHPVQWLPTGLNYSGVRYKGYYQRIARLKNVRLVPITTSTFDLTDHARAVVAIAGTVGWEAIMKLKPVIGFGAAAWYEDFPYVFKVSDVDSCRRAIAIIKQGVNITDQDRINFLKSFDEASLRDSRFLAGFKKNSDITEEQSLKNIVESIDKELKSDYHFN
ncbi:MAG: hypothetical protein Q8P32_01545 [Candidatus Komeilibacteria bacterium]|nr:hypothetical protein [Candidatus Komeilibacteria bacterium]